jgi:hypothetical protein
LIKFIWIALLCGGAQRDVATPKNDSMQQILFRNFVFNLLIIFVLLISACGKIHVEKGDSTVSITCSPKTLVSNEWAVLSILQFSRNASNNSVDLRDEPLAEEALFDRVSRITGTTKDGRWFYALQTYLIRPQSGIHLLSISRDNFNNLPSDYPFFPMTIEQK